MVIWCQTPNQPFLYRGVIILDQGRGGFTPRKLTIHSDNKGFVWALTVGGSLVLQAVEHRKLSNSRQKVLNVR